MSTVLVLGGGIGGTAAANALRERLGERHRIVVIDRDADQVFAPSLLWLMVGRRRPAAISRPLATMLRPGIDVVHSQIRGLDPVARRVTTDAGELTGDAIVIALGAELAPEAMPGYVDAGYDFFTLEGAGQFAGALSRFEGGRVVVAVSALPFKCPAAPYEAAFLVDADLRRRGLRDRSTIQIHTPEPAPMPVAGPVLGRALVDLLAERDIGYFPGHSIEAYDGTERRIRFADGSSAGYDLLAAVPPHRPPAVVAGSGLAGPTGWIPADRGTLETTVPNVFAIGDVTAILLENGKLLPKAGVFAHAEAQVVAGQIASRLEGGPAGRFDGHGYCWVELGGGVAGFAVGDFYATPDPAIDLRRPGRAWHAGKVLFERYWLSRGLEHELAGAGLRLGSTLLRVPGRL
ncbi:MAG: pyridine nucleotide-disulfide oxidoreductase [Anaerolinea sp.]|nr:pyridine nucleotide-disulfide oxidoreductase [Anaerolinea sp.]